MGYIKNDTEYSKYKKYYDYMCVSLEKFRLLKPELVACEKAFKDGGYLLNGETLDEGELKKTYTEVERIVSELDALCKKVKNEMDAYYLE